MTQRKRRKPSFGMTHETNLPRVTSIDRHSYIQSRDRCRCSQCGRRWRRCRSGHSCRRRTKGERGQNEFSQIRVSNRINVGDEDVVVNEHDYDYDDDADQI